MKKQRSYFNQYSDPAELNISLIRDRIYIFTGNISFTEQIRAKVSIYLMENNSRFQQEKEAHKRVGLDRITNQKVCCRKMGSTKIILFLE